MKLESGQPNHGFGPPKLRHQPGAIANVPADKIQRLAVALLIQKGVVNADVVFRLKKQIGEGTTHVAGASDDKYLGHGDPSLDNSRSDPLGGSEPPVGADP